MSKNLIKRIEKIERATTIPRWRVAVFDAVYGYYETDDQKKLSKEEFEEWMAAFDENTQFIIIEVTCTLNDVKLTIDNYHSKNEADLLKEYDAVLKERVDKVIKFSRERHTEQN